MGDSYDPQDVYNQFVCWYWAGRMHQHYRLGKGHEHLAWLLGCRDDKSWVNYDLLNCSLLPKLLGPHGYIVYRTSCIQREAAHDG